MAGSMETLLSTEVDLGPATLYYRRGHSSRERGTAASLFSAHVYCGHGRPSQLLLSSCYNCERNRGMIQIHLGLCRLFYCLMTVRLLPQLATETTQRRHITSQTRTNILLTVLSQERCLKIAINVSDMVDGSGHLCFIIHCTLRPIF